MMRRMQHVLGVSAIAAMAAVAVAPAAWAQQPGVTASTIKIGTFGALRGLIVLVDVDGSRLESVSHRGLEEDDLLRLSQAVEAGGCGGAAGSGAAGSCCVPSSLNARMRDSARWIGAMPLPIITMAPAQPAAMAIYCSPLTI